MNATFSPQWPIPVSVPPDRLAEIQAELSRDWLEVTGKARDGKLERPAERRFSDPAWASSQQALLAAHAWCLSARAMYQMVDAAQVTEGVRNRLRFSVMQWIEAASPSNFLAFNPEALAKLIETRGESLRTGIRNLLEDAGKGRLSQSDESPFELGRNIATTQGSVVFQNRLIQLIQYAPLTPKTYARPLLVVPPCINKYYVLDLQPGNSFVRHALEQGFTVFVVSWRNPQTADTDGIETATWPEYLQDGVLQAIDVVRDISGQAQINALGFCVGGTLLTAALALARGRGQDPVASVTLLTTLLDFQDTGVLDVFVDEWHAQARERQLGQGGLMSARELSTTFSFLRPAELVWNYVSDNYLKGQTPPPFDLLYWNADSTNLPGPFFAWYFRNTYLENRLREPGGVVVDDTPLNLAAIKTPAYLYGSRDDHIVPWRAAYASTAILRGPVRFVLGASGHIAGVINPPAKQRRNYWAHDGEFAPGGAPLIPEEWLAQAQSHPGSWWPDWAQWLVAYSGPQRKATAKEGNMRYPVIEAAPGAYAKVRVQ